MKHTVVSHLCVFALASLNKWVKDLIGDVEDVVIAAARGTHASSVNEKNKLQVNDSDILFTLSYLIRDLPFMTSRC